MPNTFLINPSSKTYIFGLIPKMSSRGIHLPEGDVYLKRGKHWGVNRGFGATHIWEAHSVEMLDLGYNSISDVPAYVAKIIQPKTPIYCEFSDIRGNHRITIVRSAHGMAILEFKETRGNPHYSVVTAYPNARAHGTRVGTVR